MVIRLSVIGAGILAFIVGFLGFVWFLGGLYAHDLMVIATGLGVMGFCASPFFGYRLMRRHKEQAALPQDTVTSRRTRW